jgi:3'-5' exonuclease
MLEAIKLEKILFLDIETVPIVDQFDSLSTEFKEFWEKKSTQFRKEGQSAEEVYQRAGIYAEFGKIICISFGMIIQRDGQRGLRLKSIVNDDEKTILLEFSDILKKLNTHNDLLLCAHNGKEFDFPYMARRMLINRVSLPPILDSSGRKPWETAYLDTMELWKFGDYKNYTSLNLLSHLFDIPSPKSDIDGSMVADVYWKDHDLERISRYCQNDVIAVAQLLLSYKNEPIIPESQIEYAI